MRKIVKNIFFIFLCFIIFFIDNRVSAVTVDDIVDFMKNNNLLSKEDYFQMFGSTLNGNNEYNIRGYSYTVEKTATEINVKSTLVDANSSTPINITTKLTYTGDTINYTNPNDLNKLESRVASVVLSQLIYSIGGARGYSQSVLLDWMNQIDVEHATLENDGFKGEFETKSYTTTKNGSNYRYIIHIPKNYTIKTDDITTRIPQDNVVKIQNIQPSVTSIEMTVFSAANTGKNCDVYRKNDSTGEYTLIATVSCQNGAVVDNNLSPGTTYTYQATVADRVMCAEDVTITTETAPDTGSFIGIGACILALSGAIAYIIYRKNNRFKKI